MTAPSYDCNSLLHRPKFLLGVVALAAAGGLAYLGAMAATAAAPTAPKVGDVAKDFELADLKGDKHKLSDLTKDGPVALVVLRGYPGYQCPLCGGQVAELIKAGDKFKDAGAKVVFVYPGTAADLRTAAADFAKGKAFPDHFVFLVDPDYTFTTAYGLRWDAANETAYPSAFVLDGGRKVTFAKVSTTHGGRAKPAELLAALGKK